MLLNYHPDNNFKRKMAQTQTAQVSSNTDNTGLTSATVITIHVCTSCGKQYANRSNLNAHVKRVHNNNFNLNKAKICPLCSEKVFSYQEIDKHMESTHNISIIPEEKHFSSQDEFKLWKAQIEKEQKCSYIMLNSVSRKDKTKIINYACHRSGNYLPTVQKTDRQRALKLKGSNKIDCTCPSRIKLKITEDGHVEVHFVAVHVGHDMEVGRLHLTHSEREGIAGKLFQGIQPHRILQDISKSFDANSRISYTTNHDIHNIKKSFNVEADIIFHQDDANSVDILVKKYQQNCDNPILYYKPYGTADPVVGDSNFVLIFMNSAQQEMLTKYGNDIIMIDSTHGTNPYNIQLTTLMIVDSDYEGFPVAFLWSITQTENIFRQFFSCIRSRVPDLKCKTFMSDDSNVFFNAYVKEYGHVPNKILCDWHVKKNLAGNLSKISDVNKRKALKNDIRLLVNELDVQTFKQMSLDLINRLMNDPDTVDYAEYFVKYYYNRPQEWAHCHRKNFKKNTNMCLEKWHQEIKYNTRMQGRHQRRLDVSIANIIECLRMKFLKRLVYLSRNKVPHKLSELRKRHKIAEQFLKDAHVIEEVKDSKWLVSSSKNCASDDYLLEYYCVTINAEAKECSCHFFCTECNRCLHKLMCTCHDYAIQYNMCKHIHLVCMKSIKDTNDTADLQLEQKNEDSTPECQAISSHFHQPTSIETARAQTVEKLQSLLNTISNCQNLEAIKYATQQLSTIQSGIEAIEKSKIDDLPNSKLHSHNKKIDKQKRLSSLKKKTKKLPKTQPESTPVCLFLPNVLSAADHDL